MRTRRRLFWRGTLTLTGAALVSRVLGLFYRMLLARFLGPEGLGLFQMIVPLYFSLVTLAVAGIPIALSQMLAEGRVAPKPLMRTAAVVVLGLSLPLAVLVAAAAKPLAFLLYHDPRFVPLLWALAPALLAVAGASVLRGYFIGRQQMALPAASQVAEQVVRVAILFGLLNVAGWQTLTRGPLIAVCLICAGESVSLLILDWGYRRATIAGTTSPKAATPGIARHLLRLALPITASRLLASALGVLEAAMIPWRLTRGGLSPAHAIELYGKLTGMALPLIFFPTALTFALSTNLVPAIADSHSRRDLDTIRGQILDSVKATALLTVPVTLVLLVLGVQLDDLFFRTSIPASLFDPLAVGGFFLYFDIVWAGVLRGLGCTALPLRHDVIAGALEIVLIWVLAPLPGRGPQGVAWAIAIGFAVSFALNLGAVARLTGVRLNWLSIMGKPALAAFPALLTLSLWKAWARGHQLGTMETLALGLAGTVAVYLIALTAAGARLTRII